MKDPDRVVEATVDLRESQASKSGWLLAARPLCSSALMMSQLLLAVHAAVSRGAGVLR